MKCGVTRVTHVENVGDVPRVSEREGEAFVANFLLAIRESLSDKDAEEANIEDFKDAHLESEKFAKFGPRKFERQDVVSTNETEEACFNSISNYKQKVRDWKIDVFDNIAIATYYPHVSFIQNREEKTGIGRQTFVFLRTDEGWASVSV